MSAYLTKSRFTLAVACPTKLWYYGNPGYVDNSKEDDFLKMLAEGGFQVGELAKATFPDGVEVTDRGLEEPAARTRELLGQAQCTVFEGTVIHGNWLIRADILRKDGDTLELIEVKAKSFDSSDGTPDIAWRSVRDGSIKAGFLPYLQDVAFQTMVVRDAYPGLTVKPFLMLPDKAAAATVPGLNQMFRIRRTRDPGGGFRSRAEPVAGVSTGTIGSPILERIDVSSFVEQILKEPLVIPGGSGDFRTLATEWAADHAAGRRIKTDIGPHCSNCQFRSEAPPPGMRSGFHECWSAALSGGRVGAAAPRPLVDLYHPNPGQLDKLFKAGRRTLGDLADEDLPTKAEPTGLTRSERRRLQVFGVNSSRPFFFDVDRWRQAVAGFTWPLSFIDFEGARTALPLLKGGKPYEQIAFQFSHHVMERDGRVRHANEFIMLDPGEDPNVPFVRALREALTHPEVAGGTVFMWHHYERDVLNSLKDQLTARRQERTAPDDVDVLLEFLESRVAEDGPNAMVDMRVLADRLFFHPDTDGSSSIKSVLPAVLKASPWIKERYSKPVYGAAGGIPSLNFPISGSAGMVWWREHANGVRNPYKLLPPVFSDLPIGWEDELASDDSPAIADGGAAMTAYLRMQFTDVLPTERDAVRKWLLCYCELDTLAMVMVYEAWREWAT